MLLELLRKIEDHNSPPKVAKNPLKSPMKEGYYFKLPPIKTKIVDRTQIFK